MGVMPFHLEKGVMGLRFDYLTRSPEVRADLRTRLGGVGTDPFAVASSISIPWPGHPNISIDALGNNIGPFSQALDDLFALNAAQFDHHERRTGQEYQQDNNQLEPRNQDTPGNRGAFAGYWTWACRTYAGLQEEMRQAIHAAVTSAKPRVDYWWDCTLRDNNPSRVITCFDLPLIARVFFCTPHLDPAAPPSPPSRVAPVESRVRRDPGLPSRP